MTGQKVNVEVTIAPEANVDVSVIPQSEIEVVIQDDVQLDIDVPVLYVKSGQIEIEDYIAEVSKPDLDNHTERSKENINNYVDTVSKSALDNYINNTIKPDFEEYTQDKQAIFDADTITKTTEFNANATLKTAEFDTNANEKQNIINSKIAEALLHATSAASSETNAGQSASNAAVSERNAEQSALNAASSAELAQNVYEKIGSVYKIKGSIANYNDLPGNPEKGDVYNILDTGANYVWIGSDWDKLSETVDLTPYRTAAAQDVIDSSYSAHVADTEVHVTSTDKSNWNNKQSTLISGTNIKTINGESIIGGGDLEIKTGGSGLEICDIGMALYVDESKGLRRYLNGSLLDINTNTQAFVDRLKQIVAAHPSLACSESEWQTAKTMSKFGQVGKFVINETAGTVRLPAVVNAQGLLDLQNLGMTLDESLPNIRGLFNPWAWDESVLQPSGAFYKTTGSQQAYNVGLQSNGMEIGFNASRSSSTYQDNAPVQQEAIQYPYFIQIATGAETEADVINEIEINNPYTLFDSKYVEAPLYNASWLKSDGTFKSGVVYVTAFEALQVEANSSISVGTTVELPSGSSYTKRGLSVKTSDYTDYDFVITDSTFRLPVKTKLASGKAVVGNGKTLGLTTGSGNLYGTMTTGASASDTTIVGFASSTGDVGSILSPGVTGNHIGLGVHTDPTKSGLELADSNLLLYFYVGETVQNAGLIDAGRIAETRTTFEQAAIASIPDYRAGIARNFGIDYTAQTCSIVVFMYNEYNSRSDVIVNGVTIDSAYSDNNILSQASLSFYLNKGDVWRINTSRQGVGHHIITEYPLKGTN